MTKKFNFEKKSSFIKRLHFTGHKRDSRIALATKMSGYDKKIDASLLTDILEHFCDVKMIS